MKTTLRYLGPNNQATWHRQVEEQLKHLHSLAAITAAEVVLDHQRETKPAFRVQVRLEIPGPGPHAKATHHTRDVVLLMHGPAMRAEASDHTSKKEIQTLFDNEAAEPSLIRPSVERRNLESYCVKLID